MGAVVVIRQACSSNAGRIIVIRCNHERQMTLLNDPRTLLEHLVLFCNDYGEK